MKQKVRIAFLLFLLFNDYEIPYFCCRTKEFKMFKQNSFRVFLMSYKIIKKI